MRRLLALCLAAVMLIAFPAVSSAQWDVGGLVGPHRGRPAPKPKPHHRHHPKRAPFQRAYVSWYDDAGTHCCGRYATYGVADCGVSGPCLPQGTRIEFCDRRCVVATVDDHGPYVAGRAFDLNQNTAQAIGFPGLGFVRWRVIQ